MKVAGGGFQLTQCHAIFIVSNADCELFGNQLPNIFLSFHFMLKCCSKLNDDSCDGEGCQSSLIQRRLSLSHHLWISYLKSLSEVLRSGSVMIAIYRITLGLSIVILFFLNIVLCSARIIFVVKRPVSLNDLANWSRTQNECPKRRHSCSSLFVAKIHSDLALFILLSISHS